MTLKLLTISLLIYALVLSLAFIFQQQLLFHPQPLSDHDRSQYQSQQVSLKQDDASLHGWYIPAPKPESAPLVIYYGGNAEEVSWNIPYFQKTLTASVLLLNYRGYGDSSGQPSERALKADALAAFDHFTKQYAVRPDQIILLGRSLGTGIATYVASQRPSAGVVLVTPFDSMVAIAAHHYPFLPVGLLLQHRFDSAKLATDIQTPLLSLLATKDQVIPLEYGRKLSKSWLGEVRSIEFATANHLNITERKEYWQEIKAFISHQTQTKLN